MRFSIIFSLAALAIIVGTGLFLRYKPLNHVSNRVEITDGNYTTSITEFTKEDVSKHSSETDCWAILSGNIYNITQFIAEHPQEKVITQVCGEDATSIFNLAKDRLPGNTKTVLDQYYIGVLKT